VSAPDDEASAGSSLTGDGWRWDVGGEVELVDGPHDGARVFMPAGPLRPWAIILEPEGGALIPVRVWRLEQRGKRIAETGVAYRLTDSLTHDLRPVYALERRANPRRP
jgi:hypothetical protein